MNKKSVALDLVEESLKELESSKGSIAVAVQKLSRASELLNEVEIYAWTQVQLGNSAYTKPLNALFTAFTEEINTSHSQGEVVNINYEDEKFKKNIDAVLNLHYDIKDISDSYILKSVESSGGFKSVDFIETKFNQLSKEKKGNDKTYFITNLQEHLDYIKRKAHFFTTSLIKKYKFEGTVESSFDVLKNAVDDKLLELNPELAEQLMIAFKNASSSNSEELSQSLTTCRRFLESLADVLYPATDENINGRTFKQNQFINRIWRFMDLSIESKSNKDVAKSHVDYLGKWLQADYALTCKGVHANVTKLETTKTVFHIYLLLADLLDYLNVKQSSQTKISINKATMDELEALLGISRNVAKEIVKARVKLGGLDEKQLSEIQGIGKKTMEIARENFLF